MKTNPTLFMFLAFGFVLTVGNISAQTQKSSKNAGEIEFVYQQRLIFLVLQVNESRDLLFLLDTGASRSAIDEKTAKKLGLQIIPGEKVEGTAGIIDAKAAKVKSISIGNVKVKSLRPTVQDLSGSLSPPGRPIDGIVGYDFLRFVSILIDFTNTKIIFSRHSIDGPDEKGGKTISLPFVSDNGIPRISAYLNGNVKTDLRIDTGASLFDTPDVYINITEDTWLNLMKSNPKLVPEKYFTGGGIGGEVKLPVARINEFAVGSELVPRPFVIVQPKAGYFARPDAVGFISNNLLEKYGSVEIDYLKNRINLRILDDGCEGK